MKGFKESDWKYEKFVKPYPDPWTWEYAKVYGFYLPGVLWIFWLIIGSWIGYIETMDMGWAFVGFLMVIALGFAKHHVHRNWLKKQILEYKKRNLIQ